MGLSVGAFILSAMNKREAVSDSLLPHGCPFIISFPIVMIEFISIAARSIALGIRLAANITAGHTLIALVSTAFWDSVIIITSDSESSLTNYYSVTLFILMMSILYIVELIVGMIQAYVFILILLR
jgi:F0F1-type ATP synthase membrane subunit a